ncbi:MAG: fumarylacetoacetate hydrolase family protein [Chloroflexi bacterium]|nr:fumarylacetoacetate hydrolase family protein [Chloroflexota bacterium]
MKIVRFRWGSQAVYGVLEGETIYSLEGEPFGEFRRGQEKFPLRDVRLLAPVQPSKVVAVGQNYHGPLDEPLLFLKSSTAVTGPLEPIVYPSISKDVVLGPELAAIIKRPARNVSVEEAWGCVLGYACANDVTARDLYEKDHRRPRGKTFDTFCPLGPYIETELDPGNLAIRSRVNGQLKQDDSTSKMQFSVAELIHHFSKVVTLLPGDVLLTGSPGTAPIHPGDTVEIEIQGLGVLRNPVVAGP